MVGIAIVVCVGLALGLIIGRWWAPIPVGVATGIVLWIWGRDSILESGIQQALAEIFGLIAGLGALAGVALRRFAKAA
jgi:hypothetical protein